MSLQQALGEAQRRFRAWALTNHPTIPVDFPNAPFHEPDYGPYLVFRPVTGRITRGSIGRNAYSIQVGIIQVNAVYPLNEGAGPATNLCEDALSIFDEIEYRVGPTETMVFRLSSIDGESDANGKYTVVGSVPWERKRLIRSS
ncbi:phage tail terminator-like protein [Candidatus Macondimonas diazotrophica]|jgi:hypothetical protein|uniref:DUF3168 domain-containing protein n=1 Tax=Candidatus Macondimonas diazotrophica TaxID=2305248 RepID=A0A4Z0F5R6_9GAMM|nr:phage tail terminator-like protein [Candidatus Macondimonas diazotrophica]TFZ81589.1 hypothetical protein E4680_11855 [Candidatus Macondimonas diazotrophica]